MIRLYTLQTCWHGSGSILAPVLRSCHTWGGEQGKHEVLLSADTEPSKTGKGFPMIFPLPRNPHYYERYDTLAAVVPATFSATT